MSVDGLRTSLADRYRIERELGAGGMARELAAESRGSAEAAKAAERTRQRLRFSVAEPSGHFSDLHRAVASATSSGDDHGDHDA
jgi:hypothetical protein